ncbi:hypothetical protein cypCar_00018771 [Cyprinus carpio]|nr:hypothetical protein cypCar_00018771 [Cyprinus carpio]
MKRNFCGSTPTSECTNVSNKRQKNQNTRMGQSESGYVASKDFETRSDACSGQQSAVPLAVVEEILLNLPAHQVVQVCRLVCHEWKELVDSAAHWRERCRTEGLQPYDASRPPEDWRLFYFLSKFRRNLLKNPRAEDGLQAWEIVQNGADRWVTERNRNEGDRWATERNRKLFPENTVTRCFVTYHRYTPLSDYGSQYWLSVELLDQEKNPIRTYHPYKVFFQQGSDYPWCQNMRRKFFVSNCRLRCTKPNLLKNPSAQDGLRGWKIVRSGGDCWVIGENWKPIPDSVTSCFVTSYGYGPRWDCGSEYQICVELLDQRKNPIKTFQPEKVILSFKSSEQWCEMSHVFKNYGPGVRFIRFTHGGNDTQFWAGHYGIRVTNSSVVIYPADERYAPLSDCGSEYQICVELLDEKKKPISTFQPEKVFFQQGTIYPWRQMFHVFRNYGPGVRFIRFTHGGKDTKFQEGQHGIQLDFHIGLELKGNLLFFYQCSGQQSAVPLAVVEEILLNLPAHQVVQVCRLVCHEWKELVDSAAHWRERCRTEGLQPYDASRPPEDWRLFYFLSKFRRNLLKNPRAEDGLQGWEIVQNGADRWVTERNSKPFPDNTVTRCFVTSHGLCLKEQLIDLKKEGYSDAFMDQLRPRIKISDWYIPPSGYRSHYTLYVQFLDQEKNPIRTCHPYNYFRQQGSDYPWCQITYVFRDYGPGVQFIRFTHGGMGWSGIRVTNSSVEICPAAESFRLTNCSLLKNPSAQEGLQGWEFVADGGDRWVTGGNRTTFPVNTCFVTSYGYV